MATRTNIVEIVFSFSCEYNALEFPSFSFGCQIKIVPCSIRLVFGNFFLIKMYAVLTFLLVSMVSCQSLRRFESFRIATSLEHESFLTKSRARQLDPVVAVEDEKAEDEKPDPAIIKELIATNTESPSDDASTGTVNTAASCPTFDIPYNNQDNNQYSIMGIFGRSKSKLLIVVLITGTHFHFFFFFSFLSIL